MNRFIILNGTLWDEELWRGFVQCMPGGGDSNAFVFPDITDGRSIMEITEGLGDMLSGSDSADSIDSVWLVGYSLGGIMALEAVRLFPRDLAGLILVCSNADGQTEEKNRAAERQLSHLKKYGMEAVFDDLLSPAYFGSALDEHEAEARMIKKSGMALGDVVFRNQLKTLKTRRDQKTYLPEVAVPTLIIHGEHDRLCTPEQNRAMHELIPNSVIRRFDGVGHALPLLCPEELANAVWSFISKPRAPR